MSLLMDALRRAEQEKKQQQKSGATEAESTLTADDAMDVTAMAAQTVESPFAGPEDVTMQIEPAELERASETAEHDATAVASALNTKVEDDGDDSRAFTLDDDVSQALTLQDNLELEPMDGAALDHDDTYTETADVSNDATGGTTVGGVSRADQTSTMPSTRAVENDLSAYFDQSQSVEMPRRSASADMTLEDVAAHTVVSAQTVFAAGERPRSKRVLIIATVVAIVIVLSIGVVGLFYAQQNPAPRYVPPPSVAEGVERAPVRELPVVPIEPAVPEASPELVRVETYSPSAIAAKQTAAELPTNTTDGPDAEFPFAPLPVPEPSPTLATAGAEPLAPRVELEVPDAAPPAARPNVDVARPVPQAAPNPSVASAQESLYGVGVGQLTIARTRKPAAVDSDVEDAYAAFTAGDFATAETHYEAALASDPNGRDAHLGLGAAALARGDDETAYRHYAAVLKQNPRDAVATASLLGMSGGKDNAGAARLRMLIDRHQDSPYLRFALGNWYALQRRWGDAQQAYFDAARLDPTSADYAFNLAVSLDHLGKTQAALTHYRKSVTLAEMRSGNFATDSVLERISTLSSAPEAR